jgi:hypothetical protein
LKLEIRASGDIQAAFTAASKTRAGALLAIGSSLLFGRAGQVAQLALANRLRPCTTSASTSRPAG